MSEPSTRPSRNLYASLDQLPFTWAKPVVLSEQPLGWQNHTFWILFEIRFAITMGTGARYGHHTERFKLEIHHDRSHANQAWMTLYLERNDRTWIHQLTWSIWDVIAQHTFSQNGANEQCVLTLEAMEDLIAVAEEAAIRLYPGQDVVTTKQMEEDNA